LLAAAAVGADKETGLRQWGAGVTQPPWLAPVPLKMVQGGEGRLTVGRGGRRGGCGRWSFSCGWVRELVSGPACLGQNT
jgi:hypothetical protein